MAFVHGKVAVFKIDNSAGSLTDISAYCDNVDFPLTADTAEVTTFGDDFKDYIPGLRDGTISISGSFDATVDALLAGILLKAGTYEFGPAGGAGGAIRYTGEAICTAYNVSAPVGDKVSFSAEFQATGTMTRDTF
jgi:predicted secreted protein